MKLNTDNILTPIYVKTDKNMPWPKDKLFYILSADGLMLCRNHEWFTSCSLAKVGPGELEKQPAFMRPNYPKIPRLLMEKALGFFRLIENEKHWESALILVWNRETNQMELVCPDQKASGASVEYDIPKLPQHMALLGDIHSHCNFSAAPSMTDEKDEVHRPGLHVVIGYINRKAMDVDIYAVVVVDGNRFEVSAQSVLELPDEAEEGTFPDWVAKCKPLYGGGGFHSYSEYGDGGHYGTNNPNKSDKKKAEEELEKYDLWNICPSIKEISGRLFRVTSLASMKWCDDRAEKYVNEEWKKRHEKALAEAGLAD